MMAWSAKLKLPAFKVTQRVCGAATVLRKVPRGKSRGLNVVSDSVDDPEEQEHFARYGQSQSTSTHFDSVDDPEDTSLYSVKERAGASAWAKMRSFLRNTVVECSAMPSDQSCIKCPEAAVYRCLQCGSCVYYCHDCFGRAHSVTNIFHTGEVWENGMYSPVVFQDRVVDVRPKHICSSTSSISLCCIDDSGNEHSVSFVSCGCEPLIATMVRARLWPATPQHPRLAFCFEVLDWAEALLLECQVALKDFCKAMEFKCPLLVAKRRNYYAAMIDSFEEYRCMKVELRHLQFICTDLNQGNVCPACPKESGSVVLSIDALFGLPRKKAAGQSVREPIHGHLFFGDQASVDEFVSAATYAKQSKSTQSCSEFKAGNSLRSSQRYHALDETALFGSACRHEFPQMFVNLKHGERIAYAVWLLSQFAQKQPNNIKIYVMYDIACTLVRHLKGNDIDDNLLKMKFSIPAFHAYAHCPACQIVYSPQRCEGFGLSDGEVMERLWSYLCRFNRMTKEMRPAHRTDILTHALLYYGLQKKKSLAALLEQRWRKAKDINETATENLLSLSAQSKVPITKDILLQWIDDEKSAVCFSTERSDTAEWHSHYYYSLQTYYTMRDTLMSALPEDVPLLRQKVFRMEGQLGDFKCKRSIKHRWKKTDKEYLDAQHSSRVATQQSLCSSLRAAIVSRQFLLKLKVKYADGQKIAIRLSKSITKETESAQKLLHEYNAVLSSIEHESKQVTLVEVLSPDSPFWVTQIPPPKQSSQWHHVPWDKKKEMIQAYLLVERSKEELSLLMEEKNNTLSYWAGVKETVSNYLTLCTKQVQTPYSSGCISLLKKYQIEAEYYHSTSSLLFGVTLPSATDNFSCEDSDLESLSDCDDH